MNKRLRLSQVGRECTGCRDEWECMGCRDERECAAVFQNPTDFTGGTGGGADERVQT
ncbi:MAG: hypothetical protein RSC68_00655 [Acinetobacter sp.]